MSTASDDAPGNPDHPGPADPSSPAVPADLADASPVDAGASAAPPSVDPAAGIHPLASPAAVSAIDRLTSIALDFAVGFGALFLLGIFLLVAMILHVRTFFPAGGVSVLRSGHGAGHLVEDESLDRGCGDQRRRVHTGGSGRSRGRRTPASCGSGGSRLRIPLRRRRSDHAVSQDQARDSRGRYRRGDGRSRPSRRQIPSHPVAAHARHAHHG